LSCIHQALKKAQTERDDRYGKYEGILLSSRSKKSGLIRKWTLIAVTMLGILSLAFISYSWLDLTGQRPTTASPPRLTEAPPASALEKVPDAEALFEIGKTHHGSGRLNEARIFYEKALKTDPGFLAALNNLGVILMTQKDYPAAQSRFEKAIRLKPGYVDPCYNLACLFALTDQPEEGLRYLKRAVSLHPQVKVEKLRHEPGFAEIVDR